jgi:hypothetical protein
MLNWSYLNVAAQLCGLSLIQTNKLSTLETLDRWRERNEM